MNIDTRLFRSVLARRFFVLFVISALVPIAILASVAYWRVSQELLEQSEYRLHHAARSVGLSISEHLGFLGAIDERMHKLFDSLVVVSAGGEISRLFGEGPAPPPLAREQLEHMEQGKTLLLSLGGEAGGRPVLAMARLVDPAVPRAGVAVGFISDDYLWGISEGNVVPYGIELCAFDEARHLLFGSFAGCQEMESLVAAETVGAHNGTLEVRYEGEDFVARYRNLFLQPRFLVEDWTFVLVQSEVEVLNLMENLLDPMENFQWAFPLVVLVCFWVVLILSSFAIRRSLVPLDRLTEATRRIAKRDFSTRVEVSSGDEFDDLADAFNTMSDRLRRQFKTLATNAEIHRAILSTIDTTSIVETATAGALDTIDCDLVSVGVRRVLRREG